MRMFKTESGSLYEVRHFDGRWETRRCFLEDDNSVPPTARLRRGGSLEDWLPLAEEPLIELDKSVIFVWGADVVPIQPGTEPALKTTITTPVKEIIA